MTSAMPLPRRVGLPAVRDLPGRYVVAGLLAALFVGYCYLTAGWRSMMTPGTPVLETWAFVLLAPVLGFLMPVVVWSAFRRPVAAMALLCVPLAVGLVDPVGGFLHFGVLAGLGAVSIVASWRRPSVAAGSALLGATIAVLWAAFGTWMAAPSGSNVVLEYTSRVSVAIGYLVAFAAVLALGSWLRSTSRQQQRQQALVAREGAVAEQSAVVAERARLARDLHDVVAHHVSLIAVRAETAPYTEPDLGRGGATVLAEVASEARLALDELRGVLGILGRSTGEDADRAPQPALADVAALVERARRSGQEIALDGDVGAPVPAALGYAAYRVVQEALTNARRHAPGAAVVVEVTTTDRLLEVVVANPVPDGPTWEGGRGLAGMRERVEALGGRLVVDAAGARFVVRATLPVRVGP